MERLQREGAEQAILDPWTFNEITDSLAKKGAMEAKELENVSSMTALKDVNR